MFSEIELNMENLDQNQDPEADLMRARSSILSLPEEERRRMKEREKEDSFCRFMFVRPWSIFSLLVRARSSILSLLEEERRRMKEREKEDSICLSMFEELTKDMPVEDAESKRNLLSERILLTLTVRDGADLQHRVFLIENEDIISLSSMDDFIRPYFMKAHLNPSSSLFLPQSDAGYDWKIWRFFTESEEDNPGPSSATNGLVDPEPSSTTNGLVDPEPSSTTNGLVDPEPSSTTNGPLDPDIETRRIQTGDDISFKLNEDLFRPDGKLQAWSSTVRKYEEQRNKDQPGAVAAAAA